MLGVGGSKRFEQRGVCATKTLRRMGRSVGVCAAGTGGAVSCRSRTARGGAAPVEAFSACNPLCACECVNSPKENDALRVLCSSVQEASESAVGCALTGPRARNLAQFDAHETGAKRGGFPVEDRTRVL